MSQLVGITEAAEILGVHRTTLHRWIKRTLEGEMDLPFKWQYVDRDGVPAPPYSFSISDLESWIDRYEDEPGMGRPLRS